MNQPTDTAHWIVEGMTLEGRNRMIDDAFFRKNLKIRIELLWWPVQLRVLLNDSDRGDTKVSRYSIIEWIEENLNGLYVYASWQAKIYFELEDDAVAFQTWFQQ